MLWRFKVKESMHFVEQKQTLVKMRRNRKCKIPHTVLERRTLCFSSYKNRKLKVKLWWVGAREKREGIFCTTFFGALTVCHDVTFHKLFPHVWEERRVLIMSRTCFCHPHSIVAWMLRGSFLETGAISEV